MVRGNNVCTIHHAWSGLGVYPGTLSKREEVTYGMDEL